METTWIARAMVAMAASATLAGCVVFPIHVYVADAAGGTPVYERCSLNPHVPVGVMVERPGLHATVSLVQQYDGGFVAVQCDLPKRQTMVLRETTIVIDARDGKAPLGATIPYVNPVGPAGYPEPLAVLKRVIPVDAEMKGGRLPMGDASSDRHYWVAGRFDGHLADEVWVTLPAFTLNGVPQELPAIHFDKRFMIARGLFNC